MYSVSTESTIFVAQMKKRFTSGLLFLVMMIVVLHNAVPHHHHEGVVMHSHDMHHDHQNPGSEDDHHAEQCIIQTIDFSIPRIQTVKALVFPCTVDHVATLVNTDPVTSPEVRILLLRPPGFVPPGKGILLELSLRGPPRNSFA